MRNIKPAPVTIKHNTEPVHSLSSFTPLIGYYISQGYQEKNFGTQHLSMNHSYMVANNKTSIYTVTW